MSDPLAASFRGHTPTLSIGKVLPRPISEHEKKKYDAIWSFDEYHENSPGAASVDFFIDIARPRPSSSILDVGCGSGAASRLLKDKGFNVTGFDLTREGWSHKDIPLITGSIWRDVPQWYDYSYCCDVMEHVPEQLTGLTISKILNSADACFFSVCFLPDAFGSYIGEPLHLTVKPFVWWRSLFRELGELIDARDLIDNGIFVCRK